MSEDWAVVVRQDKAETAPSEVAVVDLTTGETGEVATPPAASGGSWALTAGDLYFPTYGDGGAYCLATAALADSNGEDGWCAPDRSGFSGLTASEHGVGDDDLRRRPPGGLPHGQPPRRQRRAAAARGSGRLHGVGRRGHRRRRRVVRGAQAAPTGGGPFPRLRRRHLLRPRTGHDRHRRPLRRLGLLRPRPAGSRRAGPADALDPASARSRSPTSPPSTGNAFLGEPTCGGGVLTLSSYGEKGDEHVWATVS